MQVAVTCHFQPLVDSCLTCTTPRCIVPSPADVLHRPFGYTSLGLHPVPHSARSTHSDKDAKPKPGEAMFQQYRKAGKPVLPQLQMSVPLTCTIDTDLKPEPGC